MGSGIHPEKDRSDEESDSVRYRHYKYAPFSMDSTEDTWVSFLEEDPDGQPECLAPVGAEASVRTR